MAVKRASSLEDYCQPDETRGRVGTGGYGGRRSGRLVDGTDEEL